MASAPIIYKGISITWSRTLPPHPCGLALAIRRQVNVSAPAHVTARPRAVAQRACARPRGKAATSDTYVTSQSHAFIEDASLCLCMNYLLFYESVTTYYIFFIIPMYYSRGLKDLYILYSQSISKMYGGNISDVLVTYISFDRTVT